MIKRSKASFVLTAIAAAITLVTYFLLLFLIKSAYIQDFLDFLESWNYAIWSLAGSVLSVICTVFLILAAVTLLLGILARHIRFANSLLAVLALVYLICGLIVLCLVQTLLCIIAALMNKKYFKQLAQLEAKNPSVKKIRTRNTVGKMMRRAEISDMFDIE